MLKLGCSNCVMCLPKHLDIKYVFQGYLRIEKWSSGTTIYEEGGIADAAYFVLSGQDISDSISALLQKNMLYTI